MGHTGGVTSVAISGDGRRGMSGYTERKVRVWDTKVGGRVGGRSGVAMVER